MRRLLVVLAWLATLAVLVVLGIAAWHSAVGIAHYLAYEFANFGRILR